MFQTSNQIHISCWARIILDYSYITLGLFVCFGVLYHFKSKWPPKKSTRVNNNAALTMKHLPSTFRTVNSHSSLVPNCAFYFLLTYKSAKSTQQNRTVFTKMYHTRVPINHHSYCLFLEIPKPPRSNPSTHEPINAINRNSQELVLPVGHRSHVCLALQAGHQGLEVIQRPFWKHFSIITYQN